ncbi:MAG: glycoside hydrolase family 2 protein [Clostridiales bacterium]|nr:glycoside hydrolase family 2 protein [Clostridiales bacterium]
MKISLNGEWKFRQSGCGEWKPAEVPGCNFLDLMRCGDIPDPFDSLNESKVKWVGETDWEYEREFSLSADALDSDEITLECKMLDTVCEICVNGKIAGRGENCHREYSFPVKELLAEGQNTVRVLFRSPVKYVEEIYKKESAPMNCNGQNGIVHIRKPQYHFGWDWGPVLPPSGISGDIFLRLRKGASLGALRVSQLHSDGAVRVDVLADVVRYGGTAAECRITLTHPDGKTETRTGEQVSFNIENPELWWTRELSGKAQQPLYTVSAELVCNGECTDSAEKRLGLRTIELNRARDRYGYNFQLILNGVPLFIKGANYIPPDSFMTRFDSCRLDALLDAAQFSNMNMLRIWGGGFYADDALCDACDRRGILIWQDFCFACQAYPFFKDSFLENVKAEIACNVGRMSHHACLALWCGNNEIEDMHMAWAHMKKYLEWTQRFFYTILEPELRKCDTATPYIPGSPCGVDYGEGISSDNAGDTHLWAVWHGLCPMNYYRKRLTRFCSEFGFESLPDIKTIRSFAKPEEYSLSGEVFTAHQKCSSGNDKMVYYISSRFALPRRFEDYIYLSQVTQQECVADATEHWRRNKGRCNGSMYWQFDDCWPVCSWSSYDYFGNYKALQYTARKVNAPLSVSIEDSDNYIKIYAINDFNRDVSIVAEYEIFDFEKGVLRRESVPVHLAELENRVIFNLNTSKIKDEFDTKRTGIRAVLFESDEVLMSKTMLFDSEKRLSLPGAKLALDMRPDAERLVIGVRSDVFARLVRLESSLTSKPFSDNYFDLLPGGELVVTMPWDERLSHEEQMKSISVMSLCDVERAGSPLSDSLKRLRVYTPSGIANCISHRKIPKDIKL